MMSLEHNGIWRILGTRWTLSLLRSIGSNEIARFGELKRSLAGISSATLSERLQQLEHKGPVAKKGPPERAPKGRVQPHNKRKGA